MFSIATLVLLVILAIQAVQSDSELRQIFTRDNIAKKGTELIDSTSKAATELYNNSTEVIKQKSDEVYQSLKDSQMPK